MKTSSLQNNILPFLTKKDSVEIIFPGAALAIPNHLETAKTIIESYGLPVIYDPNAINLEKAPFHYYAHTLDVRTKNLINALNGPSKALWAFLGGFGCVEVLDRLEALKYVPPSNPKIIIGFSDITYLHGLAAKWGWPSLHAIVAGFGQELYETTKRDASRYTTLQSIVDILTGKTKKLDYVFEVLYNFPLREEILTAPIVGGNATLLKEMQGTATALDTKNKFVFLEDSLEDPKRLNRVFVSLLRSGFFKDVKAILFGHLPIEKAENQREASLTNIRLFVEDHLKPHGITIPILYSADFGHGERNNVLPFGIPTSLRFEEGKGLLAIPLD